MHILVTSENKTTLERAVNYTTLFAEEATITLLQAYHDPSERQEYLDLLNHLAEKFLLVTSSAVKVSLQPGGTTEVVLHQIQRNDYDLVVYGNHLKPHLTHLRPKTGVREIAKKTTLPLLVVFSERQELAKILVCIGGNEPDHTLLQLAGRMASAADAKCSLLHVMSQIPLRADADLEDLDRNAKALVEHQSKEGKYLENARKALVKEGINQENCQILVRHGLTVPEIIKESEQGEYDLIVIGGLEVSPQKSWHELRELIQENIADKVLAEASIPVLLARSPERELEWENI